MCNMWVVPRAGAGWCAARWRRWARGAARAACRAPATAPCTGRRTARCCGWERRYCNAREYYVCRTILFLLLLLLFHQNITKTMHILAILRTVCWLIKPLIFLAPQAPRKSAPSEAIAGVSRANTTRIISIFKLLHNRCRKRVTSHAVPHFNILYPALPAQQKHSAWSYLRSARM